MKKRSRNVLKTGAFLTGAFLILQRIAKTRTEGSDIDNDNPYLGMYFEGGKGKCSSESKRIYLDSVKPATDKLLAFCGLLILFPVFLLISLAVWIDDPGPVFFTQKRVGKGKQYILIHKFRSMRMSTPHDVPTHQLADPEQYITRVGKILRRTSLDELPQIWDIFRGRMSIIGPRPALWNQDDLVAEREKYGANDVLPGLTGLAQIQGRDELLISDKAKLDGDYVKVLKQGGWKAFCFDVKMFFLTIGSVLRHDGVVEGGTGTLEAVDYGFQKHFYVDKTAQKRVLVTGAGSYIGESFKAYCEKYYPTLRVDTLDMRQEAWRRFDFSPYDAVFHVAGIAHADVGKVTEEEKAKYYEVNTDLAIETAEKAKKEGVGQFLLMSSMIVYGGKEFIDAHTMPEPADFYGDSKWRADKGVRQMSDRGFRVAVLRAPMVYGKNSKGNYPTLAKIAKQFPLFPDYDNKRSMLYIDNLCELVSQLVLCGEGGVYFPQNAEYTKTAEMVKQIGEQAHRPVHVTRLLSPAVWIALHIPGKIKKLAAKAFGNNCYDQRLSKYDGLDYQKVSMADSIRYTEGEGPAAEKE